jgi:hypothetical protein
MWLLCISTQDPRKSVGFLHCSGVDNMAPDGVTVSEANDLSKEQLVQEALRGLAQGGYFQCNLTIQDEAFDRSPAVEGLRRLLDALRAEGEP